MVILLIVTDAINFVRLRSIPADVEMVRCSSRTEKAVMMGITTNVMVAVQLARLKPSLVDAETASFNSKKNVMTETEPTAMDVTQIAR